MAGNLLPIILLGSAAVLVMKKKKKKATSGASTVTYVGGLPPMAEPPTTKKTAGSQTWKNRQQSLVDTGYDIGKSGVDGKPGPATRKAIMAFQKDARITVDAKWGAQTAAAMAQAIVMVAAGLGRSAYSQIGAMLGKFLDTFREFGQGKEESNDLGVIEITGLDPTDAEVQSDQLRAIAAIYSNPSFDPDKHSVEQILRELQGIHGLEMTGRWDIATRILVNELLNSES